MAIDSFVMQLGRLFCRGEAALSVVLMAKIDARDWEEGGFLQN